MTSEQLLTPFTPPQVVELNRFQNGFFHPFTCGNNRGDEAHKAYAAKHGGDWGQLIATRGGWVCPTCGYIQHWAHSNMIALNDPYPTTGPFDLEPMGENPLTHERVPTKSGVRPIRTFYAIYDHPADFPDNIVVRQWHCYEGITEPVESEHRLATSLDEARYLAANADKTKPIPERIERSPIDDPYIVETWLHRENY